MTTKVVIRSARDRMRYTVLFEFFLLLMLIPVGAQVFDRGVMDIGALSVILSVKAMVVNFAYNWLFDLVDARAGRVPSNRSVIGRVVHAFGFEITLVLTSLPIVTWWLGLTIVQALLLDLVVTSFVVVYTFVFSWVYDQVFPVHQN